MVTRMKKFLQKIFQVTPAAGGGTQDANYAVPERTSPTAWRSHAYRAAEAKKRWTTETAAHPYYT